MRHQTTGRLRSHRTKVKVFLLWLGACTLLYLHLFRGLGWVTTETSSKGGAKDIRKETLHQGRVPEYPEYHDPDTADPHSRVKTRRPSPVVPERENVVGASLTSSSFSTLGMCYKDTPKKKDGDTDTPTTSRPNLIVDPFKPNELDLHCRVRP